MLAIEEIVLVCLIQAGVNAASNFRKYHQLDIFVFQHDRCIIYVHLLQRDTICKWIWIDLSGASLIDPFLKEHRVGIRAMYGIRWDDDFLVPASDRHTSVCF